MPGLLLDLVLAAATLWVAWRALSARSLFVSVVLFIAFGLLMSLIWMRLGAHDVALAEAAIGAGLTGALLLDAVAEMGEEAPEEPLEEARKKGSPWGAGAVFLTMAVGAMLALVAIALPRAPGGLTVPVLEHLARSGVTQPVTAVLLNFRGYDTLLEVGVLLLAALGMLAVRRTHGFSAPSPDGGADPVLRWMVSLLLPLLTLTSGHLLLLGTRAPGGAFQAGAVLASAGVLLLLAGYGSVTALRGRWLRGTLLLGFGIFLAAAAGLILLGGRMLEYPPEGAARVILAIEAAIAISTAATLALLFAGASPPEEGGR